MGNDKDSEVYEDAGLAHRILRWFDQRTGVLNFARKVLDEHIPGGARFAYVFGSGLLFIFLLQAVTGVSLALYYTPTAETAHTSVAYITKQVAGGAFLRSLHSLRIKRYDYRACSSFSADLSLWFVQRPPRVALALQEPCSHF